MVRFPVGYGGFKTRYYETQNAFGVFHRLGMGGLFPLADHAANAPARSLNAVIGCPPNSSPVEQFAAREVRRYIYAGTGRLLPLDAAAVAGKLGPNAIIVGRQERALTQHFLNLAPDRSPTLAPQEYCLKTLEQPRGRVLVLAGGDDTGTLYAAYRYAEHLGVRFYLHGDVIPDPATRGALLPPEGIVPLLDEQSKPLFPLRGIQPFHDFPEGPDWWNRDDYLAVVSQLPKLRMNFFGLHTSPEGGPNAEPTVWIGRTEDIQEGGRVAFGYPSSYQNTRRGNWGYAAKATSQFPFGAAALFERDDFGNDAMFDLGAEPTNNPAASELFRRAGNVLGEVFQQAQALGVKTCAGTETPLTIPKALREHLSSKGLNPTNAETVRSLYEGMFRRINQTYPLDYYWFWTPETWTWDGVKSEQVKATLDDLRIAGEAAKAVGAKFQLATCGWVLGPPEDRALFDRSFPKPWPVSCINREVGKTPVEPGFAKVVGRPKWAIPWLEDDPALTAPQLWAGRMRQDAVDALGYGCDGLLGIHWRTRTLGPAVSALAQAAWQQAPWQCDPPNVSAWVGGKEASFPTNDISYTDEDPVYQTVRYGMSHGRILLPNGEYEVRLKFCEPNFDAKGKRVFSVKLQDRQVIDHLDIFAEAGKNRALDRIFGGVKVDQGRLDLEFISHTEQASIAGFQITGTNFSMKINCGGKAYQDYDADLPQLPRNQPTADLYLDWARSEFGPTVARAASEIFAALDGHLPCPAEWVDGPGNARRDSRPWDQVAGEYAFVDRLAALRPMVTGRGNQERFDYWLHSFQYMRAMARVDCVWGELHQVIEKVKTEKDPAWKAKIARALALPLRVELVQRLSEVYTPLLSLVSNPGELGTVANWAQHIPVKMIEQPDAELAKCLGGPLPPETRLPLEYRGPDRLIVPTTRSSLKPGEDLVLKVILLSQNQPREAILYWRPLGKSSFRTAPLRHVARAVYRVEIPASAIAGQDFEYHLRAAFGKGAPVVFPATAPALNQTVVIQPTWKN